MVGGKYLSRMDDVVKRAEETANNFKILAYFGEKLNGVLPFATLDRAPAMV